MSRPAVIPGRLAGMTHGIHHQTMFVESIRTIILALTASFAILSLGAANETGPAGKSTTTAAGKPNVLFVVFDDLNTWIEPIGGYPDVRTPQLNRLAAAGVTFKRAHCQAPVCAPSRVSFLSGLRPSTTGEYSLDSKLHDSPAHGAGKHKPIHRFFKDAGYTTASAGKVFHAAKPEFNTIRSSLDHLYAAGNSDYGPLPPNKLTPPEISGAHRLVDWGAYPEKDSDTSDYKAVSWARDRIRDFAATPETPFFMSVGIFRPHVPLFAPQAWFDLYPLTPKRSFARPFYAADDLKDTPRFARYLHWQLPEPRTETLIEHGQWDAHTQAYLACVSFADAMFGRLLDGLEDPDGDGDARDSIARNTIIVILSDHGYHLGEKGLTAKTTLWDRATHVPLIIAGPGLASGQSCPQPVELLDIYPTLLDLCGIGPYAPLEGITLRPLLENPQGAPARRPAITTHGPNNHSIVDARHRYTRYADGSEELYDHVLDSNEQTNRINDPEYRAVALSLARFLPAVNTPYQTGETTRIATVEAGGVVHWEGKPIHDPEASTNPVVIPAGGKSGPATR